jgi:CHAD domain-containing protein
MSIPEGMRKRNPFDTLDVLFYNPLVSGNERSPLRERSLLREEGAMEVEAKFVISDGDMLLRLQRVVRLGPFVPGESVLHQVQDRYLDTDSRVLYKNGFACRLRDRAGERVLTLKGLGQADADTLHPSAIHERFESEHVLDDDAFGCSVSAADPATWPEWSGRDLVLSLVGEEPLQELFVIDQNRHVRPLWRGERLVAELSVDEVTLLAAGQRQERSVLEVELAPDGTADDLHQLVAHLTGTWGLLPETRSKFDLGLALLEPADRISDEECRELERLIEQDPDEHVRQRARLILGWGRGAPVHDLCEQVGLSLSWSYELIKRFREERMAFFAAAHGAGESPRVGGSPPRPAGETDVEPDSGEIISQEESEQGSEEKAAPGREGRISVDELCERFQVDLAHARWVRDLALALFDATLSIHKLGPELRRLLEVMGLLHNVGLETDPDRHHIAGAEIVLENPPEELSEIETRMLAAAIYLHRKRMRRKRLRAEVVVSLPPSILRDTLVLASLVRLADGLDYAQSQASVLKEVHITSAAVQVVVSGPSAEVDAARAQAKADLWETLFDVPFFFSAGRTVSALGAPQAEGPPEAADAAILDAAAGAGTPGILAGDPMGEAGRKVFRVHLARMLQHEPGTRAGEDIEELHDMRVAVRRMRAAFQVFGPHYKARAIRGYVIGLRRTGRALGAVRDLDVFMERAQSYLDTLPAERAGVLEPLLDVWRAEREKARQAMIDYLDGDRYRDFVDAFCLFVETPGAGVRDSDDIPPRPTLIGHVAPQLIYTRWAGVQAFGPLLDGAPISVLHALRIECKRLRYTLEFFQDVLGPTSTQAIAQVVELQDHLGSLNDADVANAILSDFLFATKGKSPERVIAPGVVHYLAAKQSELQTLIATFPQVWEQFNRPEVRRWLAEAVADL